MEPQKTLASSAVCSTDEPKVDKNKEKKDLVIEYLSRFPFYKWAAAYAGIHRNTVDNWMEEDKEFCAQCETAKAQAIEKLGRRATPDFMLKNVDPETFKDKKEVEVEAELVIRQISYDEVKRKDNPV